MLYNEAKNVKVGDLLLMKQANFKSTHVLGITHNSLYHLFRFRCTDGEFSHKELVLPMPHEQLVQKLIRNPTTRVYIEYNRDDGDLKYRVVVEDSDEYWLDSFQTIGEAMAYIQKSHLKMANRGEYVKGMCYDYTHEGSCCDFSENEGCPNQKKDGAIKVNQ